MHLKRILVDTFAVVISCVLDKVNGLKLRLLRRSFFWCVAICASITLVNAQGIQSVVLIKSAVLGQQSASLYATSEGVTLKPGLNELIFDGLGNSIIPSSIKMKVAKGGRIISFKVDSNNSDLIDDQYRTLELSIKEKRDSLEMIGFKLGRLKVLQDVLMENKQISVSDKSIYVDDLDELLDYYQDKLMLFHKEKTRLEHHRNVANHQIDSLETAKNKLATTLGVNRPLLYVQIASESEQEIEMEFWYEVKDATWSPGYTVSLQKDGQGVLSMASYMTQSTGVSWNRIQLSLQYGKHVENHIGTTQNARSEGSVGSKPFSVVRIDNPTTIESGTTSFLSDASQFDVTYEITNYCIPEQTNQVVENIKFTGLSGVYLPKGNATIERSDKVQISDTLESLFFDDSLSYSMGFSNNVLVYKHLEKEKFRKAIIGNKQSISVSWQLVLENLRDEDVLVTVVDRLPTSKNASVVIVNDLPKGATIDHEFFTYQVKLKSNEKSEITYGFQINAPKGVTIKDYYNN